MLKLIACLFGRRMLATRRVRFTSTPLAANGEDHTSSTLPSDFIGVEIEQARRHRRAVGLEPFAGDQPDNMRDAAGIPGLAISGGGIRSAVFSLGVLQAMADQQALKHFGYVSTVSGGSYIGAFYGSLFVPDTLRTGGAQHPRASSKHAHRVLPRHSAQRHARPRPPRSHPFHTSAITAITSCRTA
jgi:hypothetical protein